MSPPKPRFIWAAGAVAWGVNALIAVLITTASAPDDLRDAARAALEAAGAPWADVTMDGRDARLSGLALDRDEALAAAETVDGVWGVRSVTNAAETIPGPVFAMRLRREGELLTVSGRVEDRAAQDALRLALGDQGWRDLTVTGGPPAPDRFADAAAYAAAALGFAGEGRADLSARGIVIRARNGAARLQVGEPPAGWPLTWRAGGDAAGCEERMAEAVTTAPIRFDVAGAALNAPARRTIAAVADAMAACPDVLIRIDGHTDATGDDTFNYALSWRRAAAVALGLRAEGVDGERLLRRGFGAALPIADNAQETGRALNRRIEFTVIEEQAGAGE